MAAFPLKAKSASVSAPSLTFDTDVCDVERTESSAHTQKKRNVTVVGYKT